MPGSAPVGVLSGASTAMAMRSLGWLEAGFSLGGAAGARESAAKGVPPQADGRGRHREQGLWRSRPGSKMKSVSCKGPPTWGTLESPNQQEVVVHHPAGHLSRPQADG